MHCAHSCGSSARGAQLRQPCCVLLLVTYLSAACQVLLLLPPLLLLLRALLPSLLLLLATRCQRSETDTVNCNKPELLSSTFLTR